MGAQGTAPRTDARWPLSVAAGIGLAVAIIAGVLTYRADGAINLLGPLVCGIVAGGAIYVAALIGSARPRRTQSRDDTIRD